MVGRRDDLPLLSGLLGDAPCAQSAGRGVGQMGADGGAGCEVRQVFWGGIVVGLFVGVFVGVFVAALCAASKRGEEF